MSTAAAPSSVGVVEAQAALSAEALSKRIDDRAILADVNFDIAAGSVVALLGANGAGKSTLLRILATLTQPSSGVLSIFGNPAHRDSAKVRAQIGLIGHQSMLYRDLTARENLVFFGRLYGVETPHDRAEVLLGAVGLAHRADDPVKTFSRGMTQRLAIARALVHRPKLLLADEPFDGLDAPSVADAEDILAQLQAAGRTIVLVNHDIAQSLRLCRRAIVLRQGRIVIDRPTAELTANEVLAEMQRP